MLQKFIIQVNNHYYAGIDYESESSGKSSSGGWYTTATELHPLLLVEDREKAKIIEGMIELKSAFEKIYDRARYGDLEVKELKITSI